MLNKFFKNVAGKMDVWDIGFIKMSVFAFTLALVSLFPAFLAWVQSVNPQVFIILFVLFIIRPMYRAWFKK